MIELLFLAFFSDSSQEFWDMVSHESKELPGIEILEPSKVPIKPVEKVAPKLLDDEKVAVLAFDRGSGKVLFSKNGSRAQPIASITKILSYLVLSGEHDLDEVVTVPLEPTQVIGAKIDLYQYEKLSVDTLFQAILIPSANDAMLALAMHNAETEEAFVEKMNLKAKELGLESALFYNSTGLDIVIEETGEVYGNEMSAQDVLKMTRIALESNYFRETVAKDSFWATSVDGRFSHEKRSTNQLLGTFMNSKGVKTGYTQLAGECLVNLSLDKDGNEILTVVLGSKDRFQETKNLVTWVWDSFVWK